MQATVRDWSAEHGGSASLDDGTVLVLPVSSLAGGPFRLLRSGQRVQLVLDGGVVLRVELP
jgi:hypothetical protein